MSSSRARADFLAHAEGKYPRLFRFIAQNFKVSGSNRKTYQDLWQAAVRQGKIDDSLADQLMYEFDVYLDAEQNPNQRPRGPAPSAPSVSMGEMRRTFLADQRQKHPRLYPHIERNVGLANGDMWAYRNMWSQAFQKKLVSGDDANNLNAEHDEYLNALAQARKPTPPPSLRPSSSSSAFPSPPVRAPSSANEWFQRGDFSQNGYSVAQRDDLDFLSNCCDTPKLVLAALPFCPKSTLHQLAALFNNFQRTFEPTKTAHQLSSFVQYVKGQ